MAADERDQQADALEKLARGEAPESDLPMSSGSVNLNLNLPPALLDATQVEPAKGRPANVRPPVPASVSRRPIQPSSVPPPTLGAPDKKARMTAPVKPPTPRERPAAPEKAKVTAEPTPIPHSVAEPGDLSSALAHVVEDSDAMSAPAPDLSVLARARPRTIVKRRSYFATLQFRQTIIPVLLVLGVSLPALAVGWLMLDRDSLLRSAGPAMPIALVAVGLVMLGLAVVNMFVVKHELRSMR